MRRAPRQRRISILLSNFLKASRYIKSAGHDLNQNRSFILVIQKIKGNIGLVTELVTETIPPS